MRLILGCLLVSACGGADVPADDAFVGRWFIEETEPHALYSASTYALHADGTVELVWDAALYGYPQGYVQDAARSIRCQFGDTWHSDGDHLFLAGVCEDGVDREIDLLFDQGVTIVSVGGEAGWVEPQWGWSFRKCTPDEACVGQTF